MNDKQIEQIIRQYLPQVVHMSLATCADSRPWVSEVHFAFDNELNLYWQSLQDRRHSLEIDKNAQVAGNIVTQHFLNQKVRGVYFEGRAEKLDSIDSNHPGYRAYAARYDKNEHMLEDWTRQGGPRLYKVSVSDYYVFDGYTSNPAQKFHLAWK